MWSYISRDESHYDDVLTETAKCMFDYYTGLTATVAEIENFSPTGKYDYGEWTHIYTDYFEFVITKDMPVSEQPDPIFGKGNECVCCMIDPDSYVGKTFYVSAKDYAIHLLDRLEEKFNRFFENRRKMEYTKVKDSSTEYIQIRFYYLT